VPHDATLDLEQPHLDAGMVVAGVDEVGTGPWAGCCTLAAVVLDPDRPVAGLRDSKALSAARRETLAAQVHERARSVSVVHVEASEIDRGGLAAAMRAGTVRAVDGLDPQPDVVLLDGTVDRLGVGRAQVVTVPGGDALSASIAAASIVAKVARDALMVELDVRHPGYGFAANKGYPSPEHVAALDRLGPCPEHRRSFAPIAQPPLFRF
jgi:ribonuclease HII